MEDAIKYCRDLQRAIVLVSGVLLIFAMTTKDTNVYENALNEVTELGEDGMEDLLAFLKTKWKENPELFGVKNEWTNDYGQAIFKDPILESMKLLKVNVDENNELMYPSYEVRFWNHSDIYLELPPIDRPSVRAIMKYFEKTTLEIAIVVPPAEPDWIYHHIQREARKVNFSLEGSTLEFIELKSDNVGKGYMMPYKDRPFGSTEVALFVFMFRPKNSKDGLIEIKVPLNMSTSFSKLTNQDWKELQCDWYRQNGLKYDTAKLSSRFHNLKGLLPEIGNMSLGQAIAWLEAKKSQNEKSIEMFGVSVKREFVTVVGPIILCLLMLTYIGNILHMLAGIKKYQIKINHDILMNVISPSKFFNRLNISSLTILPCLVIIVVQVRLGFSIYSLLIISSLAICLSIWLTIAINRLKIKVGQESV